MAATVGAGTPADDLIAEAYDEAAGWMLIVHDDIRSDELWGLVYAHEDRDVAEHQLETMLDGLHQHGYIDELERENGRTRYDTTWFDERDHMLILDQYDIPCSVC